MYEVHYYGETTRVSLEKAQEVADHVEEQMRLSQ
jgi:hypothetical protein